MAENSTLIRSVDDAINTFHFTDFERNQLMFRGQVNKSWPILPLLFRKITDIQRARFYELSSFVPLLENISSPYVPSKYIIEQLMTSQHFGHPTRLLDWTNDLLVGLFFACYDKNNENNNENGRLITAEKSFFGELKVNQIKNFEVKYKITQEQASESWKELQVNEISILEPLIKNPRMRVQDGLFTIFPWTIGAADSELLTLNKYIKEQRAFVDRHNKENENKLPYIFIVHKDVDKNFKAEILNELENKYGISEKSLSVDSKFSAEAETHYKEISEYAYYKSLGLSLKSSTNNKKTTKEQILELKTAVDSITTDVQKFDGNPFPAIIEAWVKKVDLILTSDVFSDKNFKSKLESFRIKARKIESDQLTDIGKHKQVIQELVENEFMKKLK